MTDTEPRAGLDGAPVAPFVPAVLLVIVVVLLRNTAGYEVLGLYAIFAAFVGGALLAVGAPVLLFRPTRVAGTSVAGRVFLLGVSLSVAAVLLYLVYGCVIGCPG